MIQFLRSFLNSFVLFLLLPVRVWRLPSPHFASIRETLHQFPNVRYPFLKRESTIWILS
jgi:hypothetical protein